MLIQYPYYAYYTHLPYPHNDKGDCFFFTWCFWKCISPRGNFFLCLLYAMYNKSIYVWFVAPWLLDITSDAYPHLLCNSKFRKNPREKPLHFESSMRSNKSDVMNLINSLKSHIYSNVITNTLYFCLQRMVYCMYEGKRA